MAKNNKKKESETRLHNIEFPIDLYEGIKEEALQERRSFGAQVVYLLEQQKGFR